MKFNETKVFATFCYSFANSTTLQPDCRNEHYEAAKAELQELQLAFPDLKIDMEQCLKQLSEELDQAQEYL